jgi:uncharacterized protein
MKRLAAIIGLLWCLRAAAAEVIPPAPARYFNDYANVVSSAMVDRLNTVLEDFERQTSCQIWVAVYPKMQSDSSLEDYTVRVARSWRVGQKAKNNGAILFVFVQDHKMRIETGYGLEGPMPDALNKRILDDEITPRFKTGDYDGGLSAGVAAMMSAAKGEYKGTGRTVEDEKHSLVSKGGWSNFALVVFLFFFIFVVLRAVGENRRGGGGWMIGGGGFGGWSGGGGYSGGGGGFSGGGGGGGFASGGGGSFGGGGASGSW